MKLNEEPRNTILIFSPDYKENRAKIHKALYNFSHIDGQVQELTELKERKQNKPETFNAYIFVQNNSEFKVKLNKNIKLETLSLEEEKRNLILKTFKSQICQ